MKQTNQPTEKLIMSDQMKQQGAFSWNELMTTDVDAAKAFYGELLGWTLEDTNLNMPYTLVKAGDKEIAGIMTIPPDAAGMPPQWGAYVTVDDVDAMIRKVKELGGKLLAEPMDIPDVGRFCVIQDPQGATLSLITPSN